MPLFPGVGKSLPTTILQIYDTHLLFHRIFRFFSDSRSKASILVGAGCGSSSCSSECLDLDLDDPVSRYASILRTVLGPSSVGCDPKSVLDKCELPLSEESVLNVLRRCRFEWKPAFFFFNWSLSREDYSPGSLVCNEMLDILGRAKELDLMRKVFDNMSEWNGASSLVNEETFQILWKRYVGAHRVQEAVDLLYKRKEYGFEVDTGAFQMLLVCLCRYKHIEVAEALFLEKLEEFPPNIKSWNIILKGWCLVGRHQEAERFWKDMLGSGCKPDLYTYATFIDSLAKAGQLPAALELFNDMWEKGCHPDVVVCNCVIDALCFQKRIPDALQIFKEMPARGCQPNIATYNTIIKHICRIRRIGKAYELINEMEKKGLHPDSKTFIPFLRASRNPKEVSGVLDRMQASGCEIGGDVYNLVLSLYLHYDYLNGVDVVWSQMERKGLGPDQRCYTARIHLLCRKGRLDEAQQYFSEMQSKGMLTEISTKILMSKLQRKAIESTLGMGTIQQC